MAVLQASSALTYLICAFLVLFSVPDVFGDKGDEVCCPCLGE